MADNANKIMPMNGHVEFSKTFITNLHWNLMKTGTWTVHVQYSGYLLLPVQYN